MRTRIIPALISMMFGCSPSTPPPGDAAVGDTPRAADDAAVGDTPRAADDAAVGDTPRSVDDGAASLGVACGDVRCREGQLCVEGGQCGCEAPVDGHCPAGTTATDPFCVARADGGVACFYQRFSDPRCADSCLGACGGLGCRCTSADGGVLVVPGCY